MLNRASFALILLTLVACGASEDPLPKGEIVPMKTIAAEIQEKPYECYEYSAANDTCSAVAKRTLNGNEIVIEAELQDRFPGVGLILLKMKADYQIRGDTYCTRYDGAELRAFAPSFPAHVSDRVSEQLLTRFQSQGLDCYSYLRGEDGLTYSVSRSATGQIRGPADRVWFFASPKRVSG